MTIVICFNYVCNAGMGAPPDICLVFLSETVHVWVKSVNVSRVWSPIYSFLFNLTLSVFTKVKATVISNRLLSFFLIDSNY